MKVGSLVYATDQGLGVLARDFVRHGVTCQTDPAIEFRETHKQPVFDLLSRQAAFFGFRWAMAWDVDETFERGMREKLEALPDADQVTVTWLNLWEDARHIRIDGPFDDSRRVKFYNLTNGIRWKFAHPITNGAKPEGGRLPVTRHSGIVCLHAGLMTRQLRELHKARWDRIYTAAVGGNPYKLWEYATDPAITPTIVENPYL